MDVSSALDSLLNEIEENCENGVRANQYLSFQGDSLLLIKHKLPAVSLEALNIVRKHLSGQKTLELFQELEIRCWRFLEENLHGQDLASPQVSATRALVCVLHYERAGDQDDFVGSLSFFLRLANNVEPHQQEQLDLLKQHFAECLAASKEQTA